MNTRNADKETLTPLQRGLEVAIIVAMLLLAGFLVYHQVANTGFFTDQFGWVEMVCLYGPLFLGLASPAVRAFTGQRNPGRPLEAATSLFLAVGSLWLLRVFPFDFTHLADALPEALRFVLAWTPDILGKVILVMQIILGPVSAVVASWKYLSVRSQEPMTPSSRRNS